MGRECARPWTELRRPYFEAASLVGASDQDAAQFLSTARSLGQEPDHPNRWPVLPDAAAAACTAFRDDMLEYFTASERTGRAIVSALGRALGYDTECFARWHARSDHTLELKRYPPRSDLASSASSSSLRLPEHADMSSVTLLVQDSLGGLEVWDRAARVWIAAPARPDAVLVNTGDFLALWSQGALPSTQHRVVFRDVSSSSNARLSIVFFFIPDWDAPLDPSLATHPGTVPDVRALAKAWVGDRMPNA